MSFSQRVKEFGAGRTENTTGYISVHESAICPIYTSIDMVFRWAAVL